MIWEKSGDAYYAVVADIEGRPIARLIADPCPGGGWDWAAWSEGVKPANERSGTARTAQEAMRAAEQAAGT
jgi:hypothetical protein